MTANQNINDSAERKDPDKNEVFQTMYKDEERNRLVIQDILNAHNEGRECLVLCVSRRMAAVK